MPLRKSRCSNATLVRILAAHWRGLRNAHPVSSPRGATPLVAAATLVLVVAGSVTAVARPAAADTIVSNCSEAAFDTAVAGGGTVLFGADCTLTLTKPVTIRPGLIVDVEAGNHQVVLDGATKTRHFIVSGGSLTLSGLILRNGQVLGASGVAGAAGPAGINQNPGSGQNGTDGGPGGPGRAGNLARGGSLLITSGQVTLDHVSMIDNTVSGGTGAAGGPGGFGGLGGTGRDGALGDNGTPASPFAAETNGGPGGPAQTGGKGGAGGRGGPGGNGGAAEGGAIYNAGTLHLNSVTLVGNFASGVRPASAATAGAVAAGPQAAPAVLAAKGPPATSSTRCRLRAMVQTEARAVPAATAVGEEQAAGPDRRARAGRPVAAGYTTAAPWW